LNWAQAELLRDLHECSLILKARQLGFTTFIIFMLDACLFNSNIRAGTIAHRLDDARVIFRDKVKFPYDHLPEMLKAARPIIRDSFQRVTFRGAAPPAQAPKRGRTFCGCATVRTYLCSHGEATMAATKKLTSGQKAAQTRKRRAAGRKAAATRKRRATAAKAAATRKKNKA
jgi:hypothetical protein